MDEVDRLVDVLSKHAPPQEVEKRKRHARPIVALLERIIETKPDVQVKGDSIVVQSRTEGAVSQATLKVETVTLEISALTVALTSWVHFRSWMGEGC